MKTTLLAGAALLLLSAPAAHAHRLDEYLQATLISLGKDRVQAQIRLTPGVAVFPRVFGEIDANADGMLSGAEQRAYAARVVRDMSLAVDGTRVPLRVTALTFASVAEMREGRGEIQIDVDAVVPDGGFERGLAFENRHLPSISVYLVNALHPRDLDIQINRQTRNYEQSSYRMDYVQAGVVEASPTWWAEMRTWIVVFALVLLASLGVLAVRRLSGGGAQGFAR